MTSRLLRTFLFMVAMTASAVAQTSEEPLRYGLEGSDPADLKKAISLLVKWNRTEAVAALQTLQADTTLITRVFAHNVDQRERSGRKLNRSSEYQRAVAEVEDIRRAAEVAGRRLVFRRDTGIHCAFDLPDTALAMLARQGAVVMPWTKNEMYEWYDDNYPFVTTDLVYHTFMMLVRAAFDEMENLTFKQELADLAHAWAVACGEQADALADASLEDLARDNQALLAVAAILATDEGNDALDGLALDPVRRSHVEAEVARVREASYIGESPLLGGREDYTEYRTRGRASGEHGDGYFRARLWLARAMFPVTDTQATRRALLLTDALLEDPAAWGRWADLDRATGIIAGPQDDPDVRTYRDLAASVTGRDGAAAIRAVLADADALARFSREAAQWPIPRIDSSPAFGREATLGLRLLGQRRSSDGVLLQELAENSAWPISGLQVIAGLFDIPDEGTVLAATQLKLPPSAATVAADSVGLISGYRRCHAPLFDTPEGLPAVFRSPVWRDKQINSALGAWAETRHAAAPYLKSAHMYAGGSMSSPRLQGYVEPYPEFYRRLSDLADVWDQICGHVGVYDAVAYETAADPKAHRLDAGRFPEFIEILNRLADMAERELQAEPQTGEDAKFLKKLGPRLRRLCFNHSSMNVAEEPMSRVIDVATEYQSGQVLEVGVGMAHAIFVAVKDEEETVVCRGAVYGYHELIVPVTSRLDDSAWGGLSAGTTVFGKGPWLAEHSALYYRPVFGAGKLAEFQAAQVPRHRPRGNYPWSTEINDHYPVRPWVGGRIEPDDVGILIAIAAGDDMDPGLIRFANGELSRWGDQPRVLAYWRSVLDGITAEGRLFGGTENITTARLFWALQVMGMHGQAGDSQRLADIRRLMDTGAVSYQTVAHWESALSWALEVAEGRVGGNGG